MTHPALVSVMRPAAVVVAGLASISVVVAVLEAAGISDASSVYLLAVVATGVIAGAVPAAAAAIGAFLIYNVLFVDPRFTLLVHDSREWLDLLLLLVVGLVVSRLAGRSRDRAEEAAAREREALAMFRVSFALASSETSSAALTTLVGLLSEAVAATRVWVEVGDRVVADTDGGKPPSFAVHSLLGRRPGERPAVWTRVHAPGGGGQGTTSRVRPSGDPAREGYRIAIAAGAATLGSIWVERPRATGAPTAGETRVLAAAADQIGRGLERDRLAEEAASAEVARRSDALKSALLDLVSHDLRTPLASIRAAAGALMDPDVQWTDAERVAAATSIDGEAERLNRLVTNLLDMSRIEAGQLRATTSLFVLHDLVIASAARAPLRGRGERLTIDVPEDLPPVEVDDVLFDQVLVNLLENADRYAGADAAIRITATATSTVSGDDVELRVEDAGPGVPDESLTRIFEKFYRVPLSAAGSRRGLGMGLGVVRGLMSAMGGTVAVGRSDLGGLLVVLTFRAARLPDPVLSPTEAAG